MTNPVVTSAARSKPLTVQVGTATLARFFINTSRRFMYPFAAALSRGIGVPLISVTSLIALNQFTGLLSPLFGPLGDRWGYRTMMLIALALLGTGMLAVGVLPFYGVLLVGVLLAGLAKSIYDPALQAYVGERVTYNRRGMVIGLIELSWAGAALIGIPLMGLLIAQFGWRAPFIFLGIMGFVSIAALAWAIPGGEHKTKETDKSINFRHAWRQLRQSRAALGVLGFGFFVAMANDSVFVVYGAWLETSFGLGLVALGTATTVIGIAELTGETLTATLSDRSGLKRAVTIGIVFLTASYLVFPLIGNTLSLALVGLFIVFISFEFTIVTSFSLVTEVLPGARATMMSAYLASSGLGRVVGALIGGPLWLSGNILAVGLVSAVLTAISLLFFLWGLRRWQV